MALGLLEMALEGVAERFARGGLRHAGQRLEQLVLGAVEVLDLIFQQRFQGIKHWELLSPPVGRVGKYAEKLGPHHIGQSGCLFNVR